MKTYYKERAPVYDVVYSYPERQKDLRFLEEYVTRQFVSLDVLEIAAGTGYWTQFISKEARSVLATDVNHEVLEHLKCRQMPHTVNTRVVDAYSLRGISQEFEGAFAGLWLSHIPKQQLDEFVLGLHSRLIPGAKVVFIDNSAVQCERLPITDTDQFGNTYQDRFLKSGKRYKVLKNFPTEKELLDLVKHISSDYEYLKLDNFWLFAYKAG